ncbi:hypothetical protein A3D88_02040 [Candidatus Peribacteria bacterium RIFCSPHIGHO2_02_FULL_52_16]|nr:MAG: hypothetical protein A2706_00160 [Candidatus Peribacteria bacterium RIFCSPHIGHO2_01_FULL_51_35]OGJ61405.1 MAG: hypothetical protein A3D88_02040 [Candidatus Peribacteria bacterium RIFCSPHIGHO2_02_FULL_52_16]
MTQKRHDHARMPAALVGIRVVHRKLIFLARRLKKHPAWGMMLSATPYVAACIAIAVASSQIVPINMDEFIAYHPIVCIFYPLNALNVYREACGLYDLDVLGTGMVLPLRAFGYLGSSMSLLYFPFFLLWRDVESARLLGCLLLSLQAFCIAKLFRFKIWMTFAAVWAFFPYAFQHVIDTGPLGLQTTSVFLLYLLFRNWTKTIRMHFLLSVALILFFCLWTKMVFLWLLPGVAVLFLLEMIEQRNTLFRKKNVWKIARQASVAAAALFLPLGTLLFSTTPGSPSHRPLLAVLLKSEQYGWKELWERFWDLLVTFRALHPLEATHRVFEPERLMTAFTSFTTFYDVTVFLAPAAFCVLLLIALPLRVSGKKLLRALLFHGLFVMTFIIIARTKAAGSMHHAILAFPFLILAYASTAEAVLATECRTLLQRLLRAGVILLGVVIIAENLFLYGVMFTLRPRTHDDPSKVVVHRILYDPLPASEYIYVVTDWGMYYYLGLFGERAQSVVYFQPVNTKAHIAELQSVAAAHSRKLLFIYNSKETADDLPLITATVPAAECGAIPPGAVWRILAQDVHTIPGCAQAKL